MKMIEQLELKDLKQAFKRYVESTGTPTKFHANEWKKFWSRLTDKCSVVDKV